MNRKKTSVKVIGALVEALNITTRSDAPRSQKRRKVDSDDEGDTQGTQGTQKKLQITHQVWLYSTYIAIPYSYRHLLGEAKAHWWDDAIHVVLGVTQEATTKGWSQQTRYEEL